MFSIENKKLAKTEERKLLPKPDINLTEIKMKPHNTVIKMKWFFAKKLNKTFWVILDCKGKLILWCCKEYQLIPLFERPDLLNEEILKTSIVSVTMDYMGGGNFKIVIWSGEMVLIDYNCNISFEDKTDKPMMQEITEIYDIAQLQGLPSQFIYKWIYIPTLGLSCFLARKEIYLLNQTNHSLVTYELKKLALRQNLLPFCNYDPVTKLLNLVVSTNEKVQTSTLTLLSLLIVENKDKSSHQLVPIHRVPIHPSILSVPSDLISLDYLGTAGKALSSQSIDTKAPQEIVLLTKAGAYFVTLESQAQRDCFDFSKNRADFYAVYRQKKLKKLKHIDVNGEKAGLMGRIFKAKKKGNTLLEILKGNNEIESVNMRFVRILGS